jgi:hypothetical protein
MVISKGLILISNFTKCEVQVTNREQVIVRN